MEMHTLSGSDLTVSALSMGTVNFGAKISQEQAFAHLDRYMELGGNFLDTAHVYSDWIPGERSRSEKIIGRWMKCRRPTNMVICTKGGHFHLDTPHISRVTPEELKRDLEESLDSLETDCIDLYMLHRDNLVVPVDEIVDCLDDFVRSGRVRPDLPKPPVGTLRRVVIEHVTGCDNGPRGSYLLGVPEKPIEDVILHDIHLGQHPSVKPVTTGVDFDEMRGIYPDAHMIDDIGDAPAYGLWARHVKALRLSDYEVIPTAADPRPAFALDEDVEYSLS